MGGGDYVDAPPEFTARCHRTGCSSQTLGLNNTNNTCRSFVVVVFCICFTFLYKKNYISISTVLKQTFSKQFLVHCSAAFNRFFIILIYSHLCNALVGMQLCWIIKKNLHVINYLGENIYLNQVSEIATSLNVIFLKYLFKRFK